jgi:hypothetical protein
MFHGQLGIDSYTHIRLYYQLTFHPDLARHNQALSLTAAFDHATFGEQ